MKKYLIYTLAAGLLIACEGKTHSDQDEGDSTHHMMAEHAHESQDPEVAAVMTIHDQIMPQTSTIMDLKKQLETELARLDSSAAKNAGNHADVQQEIKHLITSLDDADHAMMNWMHQYKADTLEKLNQEQRKAYLADQKQSIEGVRDLTTKSIDQAKVFINGHRKL